LALGELRESLTKVRKTFAVYRCSVATLKKQVDPGTVRIE
jgi:hypothetical protein